ncbi:P-loop containing nucleoside triphosphate hydrolase protein [Mycena olivaceomarginata]|nr:P-loop containing nucleoside triphosphate hydrolase protein [Mycena olivaceomarginata]
MSSDPTDEMNELNGLNWCQGLLLDPSMVSYPFFPAGRSLFSDLLRDSRQAFEAGDSNDTITVFTPGPHKQAWAYPSEFDCRPWESIHLPGKEELLRDILNFEGRGDFYQRHGIPWRRGYLLYGAPGTGKTSLVKALAGHRKRTLYIINLGDEGLSDGALRTLLERVPRISMILIEDLTGLSTQQKGDCVQGVTLPGLLNALDGVTGTILTFFITTNDIAGLDPALTRPGRLGYHLEFHSATSSQMHSMLAAHYPEYGPERLKGITDNIEPGTTMAGLQEMILQGSFDFEKGTLV